MYLSQYETTLAIFCWLFGNRVPALRQSVEFPLLLLLFWGTVILWPTSFRIPWRFLRAIASTCILVESVCPHRQRKIHTYKKKKKTKVLKMHSPVERWKRVSFQVSTKPFSNWNKTWNIQAKRVELSSKVFLWSLQDFDRHRIRAGHC